MKLRAAVGGVRRRHRFLVQVVPDPSIFQGRPDVDQRPTRPGGVARIGQYVAITRTSCVLSRSAAASSRSEGSTPEPARLKVIAGGGPENTLSLLDLVDLLEQRFDRRPSYSFAERRPGDQRIFVSDNRRAASDFGWKPEVDVNEGVAKLLDWLQENQHLFPQDAAGEREA